MPPLIFTLEAKTLARADGLPVVRASASPPTIMLRCSSPEKLMILLYHSYAFKAGCALAWPDRQYSRDFARRRNQKCEKAAGVTGERSRSFGTSERGCCRDLAIHRGSGTQRRAESRSLSEAGSAGPAGMLKPLESLVEGMPELKFASARLFLWQS